MKASILSSARRTVDCTVAFIQSLIFLLHIAVDKKSSTNNSNKNLNSAILTQPSLELFDSIIETGSKST